MSRACCVCWRPVHACFGFVLAGDVLDGRRVPRELCGRYALIFTRCRRYG